MQLPFIDLKTQYETYKTQINQEMLKVLESTQFIMGEEVNTLEQNLKNYTNAKYAITCSSGTDALLLALMALDVKAGDEVITSPFTFIATAEVISLLGAKAVFVDINEDDFLLDTSKVEELITPKTKAIIPVSLYGQCADMNTINAIAEKHGIAVIEDGAQSFGAEQKGKKSCSLSSIGCTSFFPSKPLGCYGDGGAVFCDDDSLAHKLKMLLNHGQQERYKHDIIGINGRLDTIQAAVLNVKLKHFEDEVKKREELGKRYNDLLSDIVQTPKTSPNNTHVYAQYTIRVQNRDEFAKKLNSQGIPTAVHYPIPLHLQPAFKDLGYKKGDFAVSEKLASEVLSLPMSPFLTFNQQDMVVEAIKKALK